MGKGKLAKFADMETYENVFQYPFSVIENVPFVFVQFSEQSDANLRTCLLLLTVQKRGKNFGVVHNKNIPLVKVIKDIFKNLMFNRLSLSIHHHQAGFVTFSRWVQSNLLLW